MGPRQACELDQLDWTRAWEQQQQHERQVAERRSEQRQQQQQQFHEALQMEERHIVVAGHLDSSTRRNRIASVSPFSK